MTRAQNPNLETLMLAVDQLGDLADEMVFLGLAVVVTPPLLHAGFCRLYNNEIRGIDG